jgi:hypothetical protein
VRQAGGASLDIDLIVNLSRAGVVTILWPDRADIAADGTSEIVNETIGRDRVGRR